MTLSPNVKRLFFLETKDFYLVQNFDDVYYMMEHVMEFGTEIPGASSVLTRLISSLNRIAEYTLVRKEIPALFSDVWRPFEEYVKTILFLAEPEMYEEQQNDPGWTLTEMMDRLEIPYERDPGYPKEVTYSFYRMKKLKGIKAGDCATWSVAKWYEELSQTLLAYLLSVSVCREKLRRGIRQRGQQEKFPEYPGRRMAVVNPGFINLLVWMQKFPGTDFRGIRSIKRDNSWFGSFDDAGTLNRILYITNGESGQTRGKSELTWKKVSKVLYEQTEWEIRETRSGDSAEKKETRRLLRRCEFSETGEVSRYIKYRREPDTDEDVPVGETEVISLSSGGADFLEYRLEGSSGSDGTAGDPSARKLLRRIRFDYKGNLSSVDVPVGEKWVSYRTFVYGEDGALAEIRYADGGFYTAERTDSSVLFHYTTGRTREEMPDYMLLFRGGKAVKAVEYTAEGEILTEFDYYPESSNKPKQEKPAEENAG